MIKKITNVALSLGRLGPAGRRNLLIATIACAATSGCDSDEIENDDPNATLDSEVRGGETLSADEILALREEYVVATLPLDSSGLIEIVRAGEGENPSYAYAVIGGSSTRSVFEELKAWDATPAEVFLALADSDVAIPGELTDNHRKRWAQGKAVQPDPRDLSVESYRAGIDLEDNDCLGSGGNPQSYSSWVTEWKSDWSNFWDSTNVWTHQNTSNGTTTYTISATNHGKAMTACDAKNQISTNGVLVVYQYFYPFPQPNGQWITFYGTYIPDWRAVTMYVDDGSGGANRMLVTNEHIGPNTYVAYGYCGNIGIWPC